MNSTKYPSSYMRDRCLQTFDFFFFLIYIVTDVFEFFYISSAFIFLSTYLFSQQMFHAVILYEVAVSSHICIYPFTYFFQFRPNDARIIKFDGYLAYYRTASCASVQFDLSSFQLITFV